MMSTNNFFLYIIERYFDFQDNYIKFANNTEKKHKSAAQNYFFKCFLNKKNYKHNKFVFYTEIVKNKFMTEFMRNEFIDNFNKIQRVYHIFNRIAFLYKYKKSKLIVDSDLCLNKLDINHNLTFCLYQENNKYLFNINEIVKIISTALMNSPLFFSEPLVSKNPYNNIPFSKSTLYNIYFTTQRKNIKIHELFQKFFLENFDLTNFKKYNEHIIREYAIDNYVKNSTDDIIYNAIINMLEEYNKIVLNCNRFRFCVNFPKDKIILAMKPFINLYYRSKYSLIKTVKSNSIKYLFVNLLKFKKLNVCFGRKLYNIETKYINFVKKRKAIMYYYDTFNKIKLIEPNFLENHLSSDEENVDVILVSNTLYYTTDILPNYYETQNNHNIYHPIQDDETNNISVEFEDSQDEDEDEDDGEEDEEDDEDDDEAVEYIDEEDIDEEESIDEEEGSIS